MSNKTKGFTIIELVIVVFLVALISSMVLASFRTLNSRQALDKEVDYIKSIIQKTRLSSLNSKNGNAFRIDFAAGQLIVSESGTTTTTVYEYSKNIVLSTSSLRSVVGATATTTVSFAKITGLSGATGTLTYTFAGSSTNAMNKKITINALGTAE